ncbi:MAG: hypothetical protein P8L85_17930 [Rubripirellula sp.]|nr:hypothetical protein [Rubripirellula sp.]
MNQTQSDVFALLDAHQQNPSEMLDQMIEFFRQAERPMELFEALKMRTRNRIGLPLVNSDEEPSHPEEVEKQLEAGLLEACREAGSLLVQQGKVGEGWMYLRPTGDLALARKLIAEIEIGDDNYDEMIQVLLHEGVDVGRGYQAVLDHQGTCNSITLYEQALTGRSKSDRKAAAARLLDHLYDELVSMVRGDISRREAPADESETLVEMLEKRKWLLEEGGYHLDTTHISSTVKISTVLDDPEQLRKAWELTQYGRRLHHQFQYPGEEPFVDFYPAHAAFYSILLGENIEAGLKVFERKARSVDVSEHGTGAIETYVDLLDRVGRHQEAVDAAIELVPDELPPQRIVPLLIEIAKKVTPAENRSAACGAIAGYCKQHEDVLGYAAVLDASASASS